MTKIKSKILCLAGILLCLIGTNNSLKFNQNTEGSEPFVITAEEQDVGNHVRSKRDTDASVVSNLTSYFRLNSSHLTVMVHWAGKGSPIVLCLSRDLKMEEGATSSLYYSPDGGRTFDDISDKFRINSKDGTVGNGSVAVLEQIHAHPESICRYVFTDPVHKYLFMTKDCGQTVTSHALDKDITPSKIVFDKRVDDTFLIHDLVDDKRTLYVSTDFGSTYQEVSSFTKSFFLKYGESNDKTEIFIQRFHPAEDSESGKQRSTILSSTNYFETNSDTRVLFSGALEFQIHGQYMFVTSESKEKPGHLDLRVSAHGERFVISEFDLGSFKSQLKAVNASLVGHGAQEELSHLDYHIVDVTEDGQIMVVVNHGPILSNLYVSTRITPHEVRFTLSLERVMFYNPNVTWNNSWLAAAAGDQAFADVHKIKGLRGIYIANQLTMDAYNSQEEQISPDHLESVITFDQGAIWTAIRPPSQDAEGHPLPCDVRTNSKCSLQLTQQLSRKYPSTRSNPILSFKSAVGIVLGTGNVGTSLAQKSNVFLSADAGLSWHQVLKGSYLFNVGDHGGIIVAIKYFKTEGRTNELFYSTNEGISWKTLKFYHEPVTVFGILTEPGENSTTFTMFGTPSFRGGIDWLIWTVNLTSVFDHVCTVDDYKRWSPSDNTHGKHRNCLLGRKEVYERRSPSASCYNGKEYERLITVEKCGCARSDYMCDFGFTRDRSWSDGCVKDPDFDTYDPYAPPASCPKGTFYNQTRGYIKIRGDMCEGGNADRFEAQRVGCPLEHEKDFLLVAKRTKIIRMDLRQGPNEKPVEVFPLGKDVIKNAIAVEYDMEDDCLFYGDIVLDKIFMYCNTNGSTQVVVEDNESVEGMSYDWTSKTLYFVDGAKPAIEMVQVGHREGQHTVNPATGHLNPIGHRFRRVVLNKKNGLKKPRGIAVYPQHGMLFYTDWDEADPYIARAGMDGSNPTKLFRKPVVQWPNGLSIDYVANRIYWVDAQKDFIASADLDGHDFKRVLSKDPNVKHPFAVGILKDMMYWDDWNTKAVYMADKNSGKKIDKIMPNMEGAMDLKVFSRLHRTGSTSCSHSPCSHLCAPKGNNSHVCLCPDGMEEHDGTCICPGLPGTGNAFEEPVNGTCPKSEEAQCTDLQFTCGNGLCVPQIWKCDGSNDCGDHSDEIGCIETLDPASGPNSGNAGKTECNSNQHKCNALDYSTAKCIPRSWMCDSDVDCEDGSDEAECEKTSCNSSDPQSDPQFRCDNGQCISAKWRCDLENDCQDGSDEVNCTKVASSCSAEEFTCANNQCVPSSWECDGENDCADASDEANCTANQCKEWQFPCNDQKGTCVFQTWTCDGERDCPNGADEENCSSANQTATASGDGNEGQSTQLPPPVFPTQNCQDHYMFKCVSNGQCIPYWWKCDQSSDCPDGSDELECGQDDEETSTQSVDGNGEGDESGVTQSPGGHDNHPACQPNKFQCPGSGECIWQMWVCDGDEDCDGGEDERDEICQGRHTCKNGQFQCEKTADQCVDYGKVCDGTPDCRDGTDESGCEEDENGLDHDHHDDQLNCPPGTFYCDGGNCVGEDKVCNGHTDCYDGSDELHCPHGLVNQHTVAVQGLTVDEEEVTSHSVKVHWWIADIGNTDGIEYRPAWRHTGSDGDKSWRYVTFHPHAADSEKSWTKINNFKFTFINLFPYTNYTFKVDTRIQIDGKWNVHESKQVVQAMTNPDFPGPPTIANVTQKGSKVIISWTKPSKPNGILRSYVVKVYYLGQNNTNFDPESPGQYMREWDNLVASNPPMLEADGSLFAPLNNYAFTVAAKNIEFEGNASKPKVFEYDSNKILKKLQNFAAQNVRETDLILTWKKPEASEGSKDLFKYRVTIKSDNQIASYRDIDVDSDQSQVKVTGLSPDNRYTFKIAAVFIEEEDGNRRDWPAGPPSLYHVKTPGRKLPQPIVQSAAVKGSSVKLTWGLKFDEKRKNAKTWQYGVFYGLNQRELRTLRNTTTDLSMTVTGLQSCESYTFIVAIVGPSKQIGGEFGGFGPPSEPFTKATKYDVGAPPKHLKALVQDEVQIALAWDASCPRVDDNAGYKIVVENSVEGFNRTLKISTVTGKEEKSSGDIVEVPTGQSKFHHLFKDGVRYGAQYSFWVRTDAPTSTFAGPVTVKTAPIPPPSGLTHNQDYEKKVHVVKWFPPHNLPSAILKHNPSYTILVTHDLNITKVAKNYSGIEPAFRRDGGVIVHEIPMADLEEGRLYYLAVKLVAGACYSQGRCYESVSTAPVSLESPLASTDIVVPGSGLAGVAVFVCLVILVLGAGFSYYFVKHRRLSRGMQDFVSRYSPASGAANIFNPGTLLVEEADGGSFSLSGGSGGVDDDTAPIIRGFADDEPLVMNT